MTGNQIIILAIVILASVIVIIGAYLLTIHLLNKKREKKLDTIFDPSNLVEEESLMNVMDEKRNLEFTKEEKNHDKFVMTQDEVEIISTDALTQEEKVNPFGVDMTMRTKDNTKIELKDPNNQNKFIN